MIRDLNIRKSVPSSMLALAAVVAFAQPATAGAATPIFPLLDACTTAAPDAKMPVKGYGLAVKQSVGLLLRRRLQVLRRRRDDRQESERRGAHAVRPRLRPSRHERGVPFRWRPLHDPGSADQQSRLRGLPERIRYYKKDRRKTQFITSATFKGSWEGGWRYEKMTASNPKLEATGALYVPVPSAATTYRIAVQVLIGGLPYRAEVGVSYHKVID